MLKGFRKFILRGNVIDLTVAVAMRVKQPQSALNERVKAFGLAEASNWKI